MGRADCRADHAIVIAEKVFEIEYRLHEAAQTQIKGRRRDDPRGAFGYAEVTTGAFAHITLLVTRTRGNDRKRFFVIDNAYSLRRSGI